MAALLFLSQKFETILILNTRFNLSSDFSLNAFESSRAKRNNSQFKRCSKLLFAKVNTVTKVIMSVLDGLVGACASLGVLLSSV